jgi:predicted ATP-dependent endonuclease of OLD family
MYISKIVIENFRNFKSAEIRFNEGVNVIIGHNNAGKSNLLKALGLIFDGSNTKKLSVDDFNKSISTNEYFEIDPSNKLKKTAPPSITISVTITESTGESQDNEIKPDDSNTVYDWRIKVDTPYEALLTYEFFLPEGEETESYQKAIGKLINIGKTSDADYWGLIQQKFIQKYIARIYGGHPNFKNRADPEMLGKFDFQFLDAMRDSERSLFTGKAALLKDVLNYFLDHDIKVDDALSDEEKQQRIDNRSSEFHDEAKKLITSLKSRVNEKPVLEYSKDVGASLGGEPSFEGETTEVELFSTLRLIVKNELGIILPATHNGLGYNNLIFISVLLAKMQLSASDYGSLDDKKVFPMLLIEEPEAHLHPSMQYKLLKFLKQNIKEKKQVRQVFVTTHSTHITAAVNLDEIICLNVGEDNSLNVAYPGSVFDPNNEEDKKSKAYVKRFLDATKSDMLFAKRVIFVEGMAEQLLMPCLASYEGMSLEDNHVTVINIGGRYFHHFLKLFDYDQGDNRKKQALNKRVTCIMDSDPTQKEKTDGARNKKCYPFELNVDPTAYEYQALSTTLQELERLYAGHGNTKICSRNDGKGKTFEYDLVFENPGCKALLTDQLTKRDELENLMNAYSDNRGLVDLLGMSTTTNINDGIATSTWAEEEKKKALIASRYLQSIENSQDGGKGTNALELEYNLRVNLANQNQDLFQVPTHIKDALNYVCG